MTSIVTASDDMEDVPVVESGTAKDTQNIDQDLGEGEDLIEDTEAQPEIAGMDSKTFNKLMPTGRSLARIFEQAKREDEAPEEEPVYYWDEDFEGSPEELSSSEKVWHNAHSVGYGVFKGMEFMGEVFANFLGLNKSKYQWILDAKEKEKKEKERAMLEHRQRKWLIEQRRLKREKEQEEVEAADALKQADKLEGGS